MDAPQFVCALSCTSCNLVRRASTPGDTCYSKAVAITQLSPARVYDLHMQSLPSFACKGPSLRAGTHTNTHGLHQSSSSQSAPKSSPFISLPPSLLKINVEMMEVYQSSRTQKEFHCHHRPEGGIADLRIFSALC